METATIPRPKPQAPSLSQQLQDLNKRKRDECLALEPQITSYVEEIARLVKYKQILEDKYAAFLIAKVRALTAHIHEADEKTYFNFIYLHLVLEVALTQCKEASEMIVDFIEKLPTYSGETLDKERAFFKKRIIIFVDKIQQMNLFVGYSKVTPLDDLYCQPPDSADWKLVRSFTRYFEFSPTHVSVENYVNAASKLYYMLAAIGRGAGLIPRTEAETNGYLDKAFVNSSANFPIFFGEDPKVSDADLDKITTAMIARFLMYAKNPQWGETDGAFFVANPDFRIIRMLFNFPEKAWVKFIRKAFQYPSIKTDTKHYLDCAAFEEFMVLGNPGVKQHLPMMLKPGTSQITLTRKHLIEDMFNKKAPGDCVRVRLVFYDKLVERKKIKKHLSLGGGMSQKATLSTIGLKPMDDANSPDKHNKLTGAEEFKLNVGMKIEEKLIDKKLEHDAMMVADEFDEDPAAAKKRKSNRSISVNMVKDLKPSAITGVQDPETDHLNPRSSAQPQPSHTSPIPKSQPHRPLASPPSAAPRPNAETLFNLKPPQGPEVQFGVDFDLKNMPKFLTKEEIPEFDQVIVHVHGGGFVAQSSSSHQLYLNRWTNEFKIPIFSIDYRLAPMAQYPKPLDDVICGYLWIINYLEFVLNVKPKQIIAIGDSAGANFITCLTAWCILNRVRAPDALLMFYPAMGVEGDSFTPSVLYSLNDFMLNYSALKMCNLYYVGDSQLKNNPFLSPKFLPHQILARFPRTELYVSDRDPLRDDAVRFCLEMQKAGGWVKLNYLKNLTHALLSMSHKKGLPEAVAFFEEAMKSLKEIIENPALHRKV